MFYVVRGPRARPGGFVHLSTSADWVPWLAQNIPGTLDRGVRNLLSSNLKHILVGLEFKAALIGGHRELRPGDRAVLFEPYFQSLILEFCVGACSVVEGLGAAYWLQQQGRDGRDGRRIRRDAWTRALCSIYDSDAGRGLEPAVDRMLDVRDLQHQDRLSARGEIDWHAMDYEGAFEPAARAVGILLLNRADLVPGTTNLSTIAARG